MSNLRGKLVRQLRNCRKDYSVDTELRYAAADRIAELETAERNYEVITEQHRKRIAELELRLETLQKNCAIHEENERIAVEKCLRLEARLTAVEKLPNEWRSLMGIRTRNDLKADKTIDDMFRDLANELDAALKGQAED